MHIDKGKLKKAAMRVLRWRFIVAVVTVTVTIGLVVIISSQIKQAFMNIVATNVTIILQDEDTENTDDMLSANQHHLSNAGIGAGDCDSRAKTGIYPDSDISNNTNTGNVPDGVPTISDLINYEISSGLVAQDESPPNASGNITYGKLAQNNLYSWTYMNWESDATGGSSDIGKFKETVINSGDVYDELGAPSRNYFLQIKCGSQPRYAVAIKRGMGEYIYGEVFSIGDYLDVYLKNGKMIQIVVAEAKAAENQSNVIHHDGSIIEFLKYGANKSNRVSWATTYKSSGLYDDIAYIIKAGNYTSDKDGRKEYTITWNSETNSPGGGSVTVPNSGNDSGTVGDACNTSGSSSSSASESGSGINSDGTAVITSEIEPMISDKRGCVMIQQNIGKGSGMLTAYKSNIDVSLSAGYYSEFTYREMLNRVGEEDYMVENGPGGRNNFEAIGCPLYAMANVLCNITGKAYYPDHLSTGSGNARFLAFSGYQNIIREVNKELTSSGAGYKLNYSKLKKRDLSNIMGNLGNEALYEWLDSGAMLIIYDNEESNSVALHYFVISGYDKNSSVSTTINGNSIKAFDVKLINSVFSSASKGRYEVGGADNGQIYSADRQIAHMKAALSSGKNPNFANILNEGSGGVVAFVVWRSDRCDGVLPHMNSGDMNN